MSALLIAVTMVVAAQRHSSAAEMTMAITNVSNLRTLAVQKVALQGQGGDSGNEAGSAGDGGAVGQGGDSGNEGGAAGTGGDSGNEAGAAGQGGDSGNEAGAAGDGGMAVDRNCIRMRTLEGRVQDPGHCWHVLHGGRL